jgi:hypothetical protein
MNYFVTIILLFIIPLLAVLIPILIGQAYGKYRGEKKDESLQAQINTVVGAAMGLLAFMLAITFQIAADRYETRKELLIEEVTNIRTTYLRAGFLPAHYRTGTRRLILEYVKLRVDLASDPSKLESSMRRSEQILDTLWSNCEQLAALDQSSEVYLLYTESVNDLVDNYHHRVTMTLDYRIPQAVLWVLFIITFFSMLALGYQFGVAGQGSNKINFLLAFIFAVVMFLILALDRPEVGLARLDQKPVLNLMKELKH